MNRQQRRAQKKKQAGQPAYKRMTREQRMDELVKNGITIKDLEKNFELGRDSGFKEAAPHIIKTCYAAICLALHELHGFGRKRCHEVLLNVDQKILYSLTSTEAIEEVWKTIGLQIDFDEPFDRIVESEAEQH